MKLKKRIVEFRISHRRISKGGIASLYLYLIKIDRRIPYFDPPPAEHSLFDIRYSLFQSFYSDQTGRPFASGGANNR